jgi:hypothetical protein
VGARNDNTRAATTAEWFAWCSGIQPPPIEATPRRQQVVSLTERRLADLPGDDRPLPSVDAYDDLLGKASS